MPRHRTDTAEPKGAPAEVREVLISSLVRDKRFQVRSRLDRQTINRYANVLKAGNTMPPIRVALVDGAAVVVDGWHRLEAHEALKLNTIDAEIVQASETEARWMAAQANLHHGLKLTSPEVREAFRFYIKARKHRDGRRLKSYREIAQELGGLKTHSTFRNWMKQDFPKIAREMAGEDPPKTGGLREEPSEGLEAVVRGSLHGALAAFRGVPGGSRGELIAMAERLVEEMKQAGPWEAPVFLEPGDSPLMGALVSDF